MHANGSTISSMYPYKIVSKKGNKPTQELLLVVNSPVILVSNKEEYSTNTQLSLMAEVLMQNKSKVVDLIQDDLEDLSKAQKTEFPSIVRILQEIGIINLFLKNYQASVVDEYEELMTLYRQELSDCKEGVDQHISQFCQKAAASVKEVESDELPDIIRQRNIAFLSMIEDNNAA